MSGIFCDVPSILPYSCLWFLFSTFRCFSKLFINFRCFYVFWFLCFDVSMWIFEWFSIVYPCQGTLGSWQKNDGISIMQDDGTPKSPCDVVSVHFEWPKSSLRVVVVVDTNKDSGSSVGRFSGILLGLVRRFFGNCTSGNCYCYNYYALFMNIDN